MEVTDESLELAIERCGRATGCSIFAGAVERHVTANGFSVVREFVGHGIGTSCTRSRRSRITWTGERESAVERRHGARDRAHGECREAGERRCCRTAGRR